MTHICDTIKQAQVAGDVTISILPNEIKIHPRTPKGVKLLHALFTNQVGNKCKPKNL